MSPEVSSFQTQEGLVITVTFTDNDYDCRDYRRLNVYVEIEGSAGVNPQLDISIQTHPYNVNEAYILDQFPTIIGGSTNANMLLKVDVHAVENFHIVFTRTLGTSLTINLSWVLEA